MELLIRKAAQEDIEAINAIYHEINFQPSQYEGEYIAIAESNGQMAGIGRLITINNNCYELGGMYVAAEYRGAGIARSMVVHLLAQAQKGKMVYCIPFEYLKNFYTSCGFSDAVIDNNLPAPIKAKINWCSQTYSAGTLLLQTVV